MLIQTLFKSQLGQLCICLLAVSIIQQLTHRALQLYGLDSHLQSGLCLVALRFLCQLIVWQATQCERFATSSKLEFVESFLRLTKGLLYLVEILVEKIVLNCFLLR